MKKTVLPILTFFAMPAMADVPKVVTDIAPVHGLAARVMQGVGTPDLIVPPGASPHDFALRPSQARGLEQADLVLWMGPDLAPWMDRVLDVLADAEALDLNALPGTQILEFRDDEEFGDHDHDHGEDHAEDEHDEHEHDEDEHEEHEEHEENTGHDGHDHGPNDPHSWLSPANAKYWVTVIAENLVARDPENADIYSANATAAAAEIDAAVEYAEAKLTPHHDAPFLVFHDAYHYFEATFGLHTVGTVAEGDAAAPGPGRIRDLQNRIATEGVLCLFSEPQFKTGLIETLAESTDAEIGVLDPLGSKLDLGPDFYPTLITSMADVISECLAK
ncbi:zinc ABC transporter substrate-binding protein [Phaeobacter sp. J2-8]|uniref:zinc ABC transporter substrate-binding protein n=1 Tax=Phaeobacter sp. J2-8 TaxID=2931394 RepID=UPI001FD32BED|nr:zinc ABC transporter substrate-binding protein [Phaeobacter sp. J2-8]MCJ7871768.1 zinc ABC transporter substrate-binding protein [Phaeobacter sp. J2-8]